jgi:uncharacterized metal-binding protein YceD (DUF177 family)
VTNPNSTVLELKALNLRMPTEFDVVPQPDQRVEIATELGLLGLKKLRFRGTISPYGSGDWQIAASLGATVVQACSITLDPVTTRLDETVRRRYLAGFEEPEDAEAEMDGDDTVESLPDKSDLMAVMTEVLALALPAWPRAEGATFENLSVAAPGITPLSDDDVKPFADLGALRDKLAKKE